MQISAYSHVTKGFALVGERAGPRRLRWIKVCRRSPTKNTLPRRDQEIAAEPEGRRGAGRGQRGAEIYIGRFHVHAGDKLSLTSGGGAEGGAGPQRHTPRETRVHRDEHVRRQTPPIPAPPQF